MILGWHGKRRADSAGAELVLCDDAVSHLSSVVDGEAVPASVMRHVEGCSRCARELEDLKRVSRLLAVELPARDPGFVVRFRERRAAQQSHDQNQFWRLWTLRLAPLAAAVGLAAVTLVIYQEQPPGSLAAELNTLDEGAELGLKVSSLGSEFSGGLAWLDLSRHAEWRKDR